MASRKATQTRSSQASLEWYQGLEDKELFEKTLYNNNDNLVLKQLVKILKTKLDAVENKERTLEQFKDPNWAFKQAYHNGSNNAYQTILDLLVFVR